MPRISLHLAYGINGHAVVDKDTVDLLMDLRQMKAYDRDLVENILMHFTPRDFVKPTLILAFLLKLTSLVWPYNAHKGAHITVENNVLVFKGPDGNPGLPKHTVDFRMIEIMPYQMKSQ